MAYALGTPNVLVPLVLSAVALLASALSFAKLYSTTAIIVEEYHATYIFCLMLLEHQIKRQSIVKLKIVSKILQGESVIFGNHHTMLLRVFQL